MRKRIFALLLCLALLLSVIPMPASAAAPEVNKDALLAVLYEAELSELKLALDAGVITSVELTQYYLDRIETKYPDYLIRKHTQKAEILSKLYSSGKINGVSYRIYFNSCNLEHVLFNELKDFTDDEKADMADDFAEKYEGKVEEFVEFISSADVAVSGTYQETWNYIEKDKNSLNRNSNMHLIFEK